MTQSSQSAGVSIVAPCAFGFLRSQMPHSLPTAAFRVRRHADGRSLMRRRGVPPALLWTAGGAELPAAMVSPRGHPRQPKGFAWMPDPTYSRPLGDSFYRPARPQLVSRPLV